MKERLGERGKWEYTIGDTYLRDLETFEMLDERARPEQKVVRGSMRDLCTAFIAT